MRPADAPPRRYTLQLVAGVFTALSYQSPAGSDTARRLGGASSAAALRETQHGAGWNEQLQRPGARKCIVVPCVPCIIY